MCREEALDITGLTGGRKGWNLHAIVKEHAPTSQCADDDCLGLGAFASKYWRKGAVYHDPSQSFHTALGNRKITSQGLASWNPVKIYSGYKEMGARMKEKEIEGNLKGEGFVQGGVAIFDGNGEVRFVYKEKTGYEVPKAAMAAMMDAIDGGE